MANEEKSGTPQGGEPQDEAANGKKLIAGKYNSVEEAVEQGYVGLEKGYHELSGQVKKLTTILEAALAVPVGHGGTRDPYRRGVVEDDDVNAADFITNPAIHLKKRDDRLMERMGHMVTSIVTNASVVNDFKSRNPDLLKHERVVKAFMDPDQRRSLAERLDEAGEKARAYLASLKKEFTGQDSRTPNSNEFVESPRGGQLPALKAVPVANPDEEKELLDYIQERQADYGAHFGVPNKK